MSDKIKFLEKYADTLGLRDKPRKVFLARFNQNDFSKDNAVLAQNICSESYEPNQNFQDHLKTVLIALSKAGSPHKNVRRGRPKKEQQPWKEAYEWLWDKPYPEYLEEYGNRSQESVYNWEEVCYTKLEHWRKRIVDLVIGDNRLDFDNIDRTFVPLDFLEKVKKESSQSKNADQLSNQQTEEYKSTQRYERQQDFLDVIIRGGLSEGISKKQGQRLAIIGETGSGKTTLLLQIGYELLKQPNNLVIWISLKEVRDKQKSIWDYILEEWFKGSDTAKNEWKQEFGNKLKDGCVWLLLDGLEDISDRAYSVIGEFDSVWLSKPKIALTCRKNRWDSDKADFASFDYGIYECIGYNSEQPSNFIDAWFSDDLESASLLKSELQQATRHRINDLIKYPLHLSLLCSIYEKSESNFAFAATKAELFDQFIKRQYKRKIAIDRFDADLVKSLGELAIKAIDTQNQLTISEVKEKLRDKLKKALELGWLKPIDEYETKYDFLHDSFKEYFAALAIPNWRLFLPDSLDNFQGDDYPIFNARWREVILLWFGREDIYKDKKDFIDALIYFDDECIDFYWYRAYCLSIICLAEFKDCETAETMIQRAIELAFGSFDNDEQIWKRYLDNSVETLLRSALALTRTDLFENYLCQILENSQVDEYTYIEVVDIWGKITTNHDQKILVVQQLISLMQKTNNEDTRGQALGVLGNLAINSDVKELIIPAITSLIQESNDEFTNIRAEFLLIDIANDDSQNLQLEDSLVSIANDNITEKSAIFELICVIKESESYDKDVCISAIWELGQIASKDESKDLVIPVLLQLMQESNNEDIHGQIILSFEKIVTDDKSKKLVIPVLIQMMKISSNNTCRRLAEILGYIATNDQGRGLAIPALIQIMQNSDSEYIRCQAAESIGRIAIDNKNKGLAVNELIHIILVPNYTEHIYWQAAWSLRRILEGVSLEIWQSVVISLCNEVSCDSNASKYCYEILWHCAQNMPYQAFYAAWHSPTTNHKLTNKEEEKLWQK